MFRSILIDKSMDNLFIGIIAIFVVVLILFFFLRKKKTLVLDFNEEPSVLDNFALIESRITIHRTIENVAPAQNIDKIIDKYSLLNKEPEIAEEEVVSDEQNTDNEEEPDTTPKEEIEKEEETDENPSQRESNRLLKKKYIPEINLKDVMIHSAIMKRKKFR